MKNLMVVLGVLMVVGDGVFGIAAQPDYKSQDAEVCKHYAQNLVDKGFAPSRISGNTYQKFDAASCEKAFKHYRDKLPDFTNNKTTEVKTKDKTKGATIEINKNPVMIFLNKIHEIHGEPKCQKDPDVTAEIVKAIALIVEKNKNDNNTRHDIEQRINEKIIHVDNKSKCLKK